MIRNVKNSKKVMIPSLSYTGILKVIYGPVGRTKGARVTGRRSKPSIRYIFYIVYDPVRKTKGLQSP